MSYSQLVDHTCVSHGWFCQCSSSECFPQALHALYGPPQAPTTWLSQPYIYNSRIILVLRKNPKQTRISCSVSYITCVQIGCIFFQMFDYFTDTSSNTVRWKQRSSANLYPICKMYLRMTKSLWIKAPAKWHILLYYKLGV